MRFSYPFVAILILACCGRLSLATGITITIDYTYDSQNFFDTQAKRDLLQSAANAIAVRLNDSLTAIVPGGSSHWTELFYDPGHDNAQLTRANVTVPANTVVIYAGGYNLGAGVLGVGSPGGYTDTSGTQAFVTAVTTRGQGTTIGDNATDFGPWGGSISFNNTNTNWDFTTNPPTAGQYDFLSVAEHEITHALGFGTSDSWFRLESGAVFLGTNAKAANGGTNAPLSTVDPGHWATGTMSDGRLATMNPSLVNGLRSQETSLDFAALQDIGWKLGPQGDVNGDGGVSLTDLTAVAAAWQTHGPTGDANLDGIVSLTDLTLIASHWNQQVGGGGGGGASLDGVAPVPEPATGALVASAAVSALIVGWRSRRSRRLG